MNKDFLNTIPDDEQPVAKNIQSVAEDIQVSTAFQLKLESQLIETHQKNSKSINGWRANIFPSLAWMILIIGIVFLLNWAIRSLMPEQLPATNGTPVPNIPFEDNVKNGNICQGTVAIAHGFSVFLSKQDKSGFVELDEQNNIGELRSFASSPNGGQLAIVGNTRGSGNLYLTDTASDLLQPVLSNSELGYLAGVAWSHDGQRLLTWQINNNSRMYIMNKDGTGLTEIDLPVQFFETPQITPNNESILFYGTNVTSAGLFNVTLEDFQVDLVSNKVEDESSFAWSPDGSRLAYIEMDREVGEARLVVDDGTDKVKLGTLPIQKGAGSSIPNSANLSWAPDGKNLVFEFGRNATDRAIYFSNVNNTEFVKLAEAAHAPAISADGNCLAYISGQQIYILNLTDLANLSPVLLADLPKGRASANYQLDKLQWKSDTTSVLDVQNRTKIVPTPSGAGHEWRGNKLYIESKLPPAPAQVGLYAVQSDRHATLDSARALAQQFGMDGQIFEAPPELGGSDATDFLVVDGTQHLRVRSNRYFSYYPDYPRWASYNMEGQNISQAAAQEQIEDFLRSHGFDLNYKVEYSEFYNGYYALLRTSEGLTIHHDHFSSVGFLFRFDQNEILAVEASLVTYTPIDNFEVISADDALQKLLNPNTAAGILEGSHSVGKPVQTWYRPRPENQTITVWGWISSVKSAEDGTPLITFDGYQAIGNLTGLAESTPNTFIEATGQFRGGDENKVFNIQKWQVYYNYEEGLQGNIRHDGDEVVLVTGDGSKLILLDVPADLPLPMENAFVLGVTRDDVFEWKSIDNRALSGGGGGGGGGSGYYKPNLTGTPVPLPDLRGESTEVSNYLVQAGDTLSKIAATHETTVDELMQVNGLVDTTIFVGQTLVLPDTQGEQSLVGQRLEKQRSTLMVTIINKLDGSQSTDYRIHTEDNNQYQLMKLKGESLDELKKYNNLPVDIWGTVEDYVNDLGMKIPVVNVERFEIPYPDLKFQILKGTQSIATIQGESVTLFSTEDGQTYVMANGYSGLIGNQGDKVLIEALVIPDQEFAGYPLIKAISISMAVNPKSGKAVEMDVTANQPYVMNEVELPETPTEPTATIDSIELVYFTPNQRYSIPDTTPETTYMQPAWRFQGHYWDGSEFEILVQALKEEFLLPEIESIESPG